MCGIYKITNKINGKVYIGQSKDILRRWRRHRVTAYNKEDEAYEYPLYRAIRKYGLENFDFSIIEECGVEALDEKELYYIKQYSTEMSYNQTFSESSHTSYQKLNENSLKELRKDLEDNILTIGQLAEKYSIGKDCISRINQGKAYFDDKINYPIRKNPYVLGLPKEARICPICGEIKNKDSEICLNCYNAKRKSHQPNREELKRLIRKYSFTEIGRQYNVNANSIKRWCKNHQLPYLKREIQKISAEDWDKI